jgi:phage FluMu protein Com
MADVDLHCPKCKTLTERGHRPDLAHGYALLASWAPGAPEVRRLVGGIKVHSEQLIPLLAYRCPSCGFIEFYAPSADER